jgi:hypothetical protein
MWLFIEDRVTFSLPYNFDTVSGIANGVTMYKEKKSHSVLNDHAYPKQERQSLLNSIYIERPSISIVFDPALPGHVFYCLKAYYLFVITILSSQHHSNMF